MERWRVEDHTTAAPCIIVTRPDVDWRVSTQPAQSESENVLTATPTRELTLTSVQQWPDLASVKHPNTGQCS